MAKQFISDLIIMLKFTQAENKTIGGKTDRITIRKSGSWKA